MLVLLLTVFLLAASYLLAHAWRVEGTAPRALFAGTVTCAQVVAIETLLGATGLLRWPILLAGAVVLAAAILALSLRSLGPRLRSAVADDGARLREALRELRHPEIAVLALLACVGWIWVLAAVHVLPPRSVDDLCHHLPPIQEAAVQGRFVILPLDLRPWFAYPLNADLLFLWPTMLRGDIRWTDGAQALTALLAALAIAAIGGEVGASRRSRLFAALVFLLMPVVLRQAASCYTDVTLAAFYGAAVWGATRHARDGAGAPLLLCGLAAGLLAGTKYHFLLPLAALAPLLVLGVRRAPSRLEGWRRAVLLFFTPAAALSAYWYVRNLVVLGNPFYPYPLALGPLTIFPTALNPDDPLVRGRSILGWLLRSPSSVFTFTLQDASAGGLDGGFGSVMWGAVLPIGLWQAARAVARFFRGREEVWRALLAVQFCAALLPFLISAEDIYDSTPRYLLGAAVVGFALLARALDGARTSWRGPAALAVAVGVATTGLSMMVLAGTRDLLERKQLMRIGEAWEARKDAWVSPWRFIAVGSHGTGRFAKAWEMFDLLSAPPGRPVRPLWIYATGQYPAGFYGSGLQNRIYNFDGPGCPAEPDFFLYYLTIKRRSEDITYFGKGSYKLEDVAADPDRYELVLITPETLVYIRRDQLLRDADLRERLATVYERLYPEEIATASTLQPVPSAGTIVNSGPIAYGLKALELRGRLPLRVAMVRPEDLDQMSLRFRSSGPVFIVTPLDGAARAEGVMKGTTQALALVRSAAGDVIREQRPGAASPGQAP